MSLNNLSICILLILAASCTIQDKVSEEKNTYLSDHLIEAEQLWRIQDADSVAILDLRKENEFKSGHIPESINIWRHEIQNPDYPYQGVLPSKKYLEDILKSKGLRKNDYLVLYDNHSSCESARLWWILSYYGYDRVAILNGGIKAWENLHSTTKNASTKPAGNFELPATANQQKIATKDEVVRVMQQELLGTIIDTRSKEEYDGLLRKNGALDSGNIPGSIHLDWMTTTDPVTQKFKSVDQIRSLYEALGVSDSTNIITYCHSGVRSAHTYFVLTELLGYANVKNYDGSWVEYTFFELPVHRNVTVK